MTTRTAALLYTSADAEGARGGGFKVTSSQGDLTESELTMLVGYRPSAGGLDDAPLPQFATPEQVAKGARALDYRAVLDGVAWWHVAPAGADATGRGSNQVMHVAFAAGPLAHRPVECWRSPEWKTPFGRDQVAATSLQTVALPAAQPGMSREAVLDGLSGARADSLETLLVFIDAIVRALETGEIILLAVNDADDAAWWLAAASHLLPLASAQRVTFSILADASQGAEALVNMLRRDGILVGCVGRASLNVGEIPSDVIVLDTAAPVVLALGGEAHQVGERRLAATEMSTLALELLVDPDLASAAMDWVDETLDPGVEPRWALAAALLREPERYADAAAGAARLLVMHAPPVIPDELELVAKQALDIVLLDRDAEGLWSLYSQFAPTNAFRPATALAYVRRALSEPLWLDRLLVPAPTETLEIADARALLEALSEQSRAEVGTVSERAVLHAVALLTQVGSIRPHAPVSVEDHVARELLAGVMAPRVADEAPPIVWDLLRDVPAPDVLRSVLAELTAELVQADPAIRARPVGERLDERVALWLVPDIREVLTTPDLLDLVGLERLVGSAGSFPPGSVGLAHAFDSAVADLEGGGAPAAVLRRFDELGPLASASILLHRGNYRRLWLADETLVRFLLTAPWDSAIEELCLGDRLLAPDVVRDAARLRSCSRLPQLSGEAVFEVVPAVENVLRVSPEIVSATDDHVIALLQLVHCWAELNQAGSSEGIGTVGATYRVLDPELSSVVQDVLLAASAPVALLLAQVRTTRQMHAAPHIEIVISSGDGEQHALLETLARRILAETDDLSALITKARSSFPPDFGEAIEDALLQLAPRGARLAQSGQKLAEGVRSLFGLQRSDLEEKR